MRTCPVCGPHLRQCYYAHTLRIALDLSGWFALTLSLKPAFLDDEPSHLRWEKTITKKRDRLMQRLRRRCSLFKYFWTFEWERGKPPHFHYIVAPTPHDDRPDFAKIAEQQFKKMGGGCSLHLRPLGTEKDLASWIGYMYKNIDEPAYAPPQCTPRRNLCGASQGLGFHSQKQVNLRAKTAREQSGEDAFVSVHTADRVIEEILSDCEGEEVVVMSTGEVGTLLRWNGDSCRVCLGEDEVELSIYDVTPSIMRVPRIVQIEYPDNQSSRSLPQSKVRPEDVWEDLGGDFDMQASFCSFTLENEQGEVVKSYLHIE